MSSYNAFDQSLVFKARRTVAVVIVSTVPLFCVLWAPAPLQKTSPACFSTSKSSQISPLDLSADRSGFLILLRGDYLQKRIQSWLRVIGHMFLLIYNITLNCFIRRKYNIQLKTTIILSLCTGWSSLKNILIFSCFNISSEDEILHRTHLISVVFSHMKMSSYQGILHN